MKNRSVGAELFHAFVKFRKATISVVVSVRPFIIYLYTYDDYDDDDDDNNNNNNNFFTFAPCILMLSNLLFVQLTHNDSLTLHCARYTHTQNRTGLTL